MNSKDLYKVKLIQIVEKWSMVNINSHLQIRTYLYSDKYEHNHEKKME